MNRTAAEVRASLAQRHWAPAITDNMKRGDVAEDIVVGILAPAWRLCSESAAAWDLEHANGTRMQVKNSAARQAWAPCKHPASPGFSIKFQTGHWNNGIDWQKAEQPIRYSQIYVFAYHPVTDETADQCDPSQWKFYVVPTVWLPNSERISLKKVRELSPAYNENTLFDAVELVRNML
jgi:hypothetical protein